MYDEQIKEIETTITELKKLKKLLIIKSLLEKMKKK